MSLWSLREKRLLIFVIIVLLLVGSSWLYYIFEGKDENQPPLPLAASLEVDLEEGSLSVTPADKKVQSRGDLQKEEQKKEIVIDMKGAVKNPGVLKLKKGMRVYQAIEEAGGFTSKADGSQINMAAPLLDGMVLFIPEKGEEIPDKYKQNNPSLKMGAGNTGRINLNTASLEQLQKLTGIGPSKAENIIRYRAQNGPFQSVDDVLQVTGIGEKTLAQFRDKVTVK